MIRYAVTSLDKAPDKMPDAPVVWSFEIGNNEYIGLEWGDDDAPEKIDGWQTFETPIDFQMFMDAQ